MLRLDPFALPVRFPASDAGADGQMRQVELDRDRVIVRRAVRGIPMKVRIAVRDFRGVSLRLEPADTTQAASVVVMLDHRDEALSIPLFVSFDCDEVLTVWKAWGRVLRLPLLMPDAPEAVEKPVETLGALTVGKPVARRRRHSTLRRRRPRILMRRKPGRKSEQVHRGEREIIARN